MITIGILADMGPTHDRPLDHAALEAATIDGPFRETWDELFTRADTDAAAIDWRRYTG